MRVLILADVHGNWPALLSLQRAEARPDAVLFAGDAVGYGPDPAECARWLSANATAVRGNHDEAAGQDQPTLPGGVPPELEDAARETSQYTRQCLSPEDRASLRRWPLTATTTLGGASFFMCHGTPGNPLTGQLNPATCPEAELVATFDGITADVLIVGHSHQPALRKFGGRLIINPGSLGQPRIGLPDATYAVWEDGRVQIRHLHYDHDATVNQLRLTALSAEVMEQLTTTLETGLVPDLADPTD
jgi:putative phosphoesterase